MKTKARYRIRIVREPAARYPEPPPPLDRPQSTMRYRVERRTWIGWRPVRSFDERAHARAYVFHLAGDDANVIALFDNRGQEIKP
ncbi:TPA: hypothetical protein QDB09_005419 [Burkholderia vietnamiensis]|nr:hypothetical protein [Burkholderia vietnamiensis]